MERNYIALINSNILSSFNWIFQRENVVCIYIICIIEQEPFLNRITQLNYSHNLRFHCKILLDIFLIKVFSAAYDNKPSAKGCHFVLFSLFTVLSF